MAEASVYGAAGVKSCVVYCAYYVILFFAFWFGSSRFDVNGDGEFDPSDVEAYMKDPWHLSRNFKQSRTVKRKVQKSDNQVKPRTVGAGYDQATVGFSLDVDVGEDTAEQEVYRNLVKEQRLPWFIACECLVVFGLWLGFAIKRGLDENIDPTVAMAGLDSVREHTFDLRISDSSCNDARPEIWRWWTYQFTHIGLMHVTMNCFLNVMLGVPLEGLHGHLKMFVMFNVGVIGGAMCYMINDAHSAVVGCSGGCYALIGMHFGNLVVNWGQMRFRCPTLFFLTVLVGADLASYFLSASPKHASHSAHVGGFIAGLIIGVIYGRNLKTERYEKVLIAFAALLGLALMGICLAWNYAQTGGPMNIWESFRDEKGWCWVQQIYSRDINPFRYECISCGTKDCIATWTAKADRMSNVSRTDCLKQGFYYWGA